jgi:SAM-dependent methyltransferase
MSDTVSAYLRDEQYSEPSRLLARRDIYRFAVDSVDLHPWTFDHLDLGAGARLLEVGCGIGQLWTANAERVPCGWTVVLSDFSPGMLRGARDRLTGSRFHFELADATALPHRAGAFDAVIANHMLYYLADPGLAIAECARVLAPDGALYATTNGRGHLRELVALGGDWPERRRSRLSAHAFDLENGGAQLEASFHEVVRLRTGGRLEITDTEAVVAYLATLPAPPEPVATRRTVADTIDRGGALTVTLDFGLFIARRPRC